MHFWQSLFIPIALEEHFLGSGTNCSPLMKYGMGTSMLSSSPTAPLAGPFPSYLRRDKGGEEEGEAYGSPCH